MAQLEDPLEEDRTRIEDLEYIVKVLVKKLQKEKVKDKEAKLRLKELEIQVPVKRVYKREKPAIELRPPGERIRKKRKLSI